MGRHPRRARERQDARSARLSTPLALELSGVARDFGPARVLGGLDLTIAGGERVAVIGPSGSGKTTLLRLCAGLLWPSAGQVRCLGQDTAQLAGRRLGELRRRVGLLHQEGNLVPNLRVAHNVAMGRLGHWSPLRALWSLLVPQELERVRAALAQVELSGKLWDLPETLSGGQQQRVAVARLLVQEPDLFLADEPAASLDPRLGREVVELLVAAARARGAALVVSLHTLELLDAGFERVVALRAGEVFWQGRPEALTAELLRELYGAEYRALHLDELPLGAAHA